MNPTETWTTARAARAAALYMLLRAGHEPGDFVVQTDWMATRKAAPGHNAPHIDAAVTAAETWKANQAHVASYHAVLAATVAAGCGVLGLRVSPRRALAAFAVSYGTHTLLDRRTLVNWLMDRKGTPRDLHAVRLGMDQAGHNLALAVCAVIMSG